MFILKPFLSSRPPKHNKHLRGGSVDKTRHGSHLQQQDTQRQLQQLNNPVADLMFTDTNILGSCQPGRYIPYLSFFNAKKDQNWLGNTIAGFEISHQFHIKPIECCRLFLDIFPQTKPTLFSDFIFEIPWA